MSDIERTPGEVVYIPFSTIGTSGPVTPDTIGTLLVYRNGVVQPTAEAGAAVVQARDPDNVIIAGQFFARIDTGDLTDENFYAYGGILHVMARNFVVEGRVWTGFLSEHIRLKPISSNLMEVMGEEEPAEHLRDKIHYLDIPSSTITNPTGTGNDLCTFVMKDHGIVIPNMQVWITADQPGAQLVTGVKTTNSQGRVQFLLDHGTEYFLWASKDGLNSIVGQPFIAQRD